MMISSGAHRRRHAFCHAPIETSSIDKACRFLPWSIFGFATILMRIATAFDRVEGFFDYFSPPLCSEDTPEVFSSSFCFSAILARVEGGGGERGIPLAHTAPEVIEMSPSSMISPPSRPAPPASPTMSTSRRHFDRAPAIVPPLRRAAGFVSTPMMKRASCSRYRFRFFVAAPPAQEEEKCSFTHR